MEVWFRWFHVSIGWFFEVPAAHFQGWKKIWRAFFLLSRFHLGSLAKASFSIPNLLDRTSPQFKGLWADGKGLGKILLKGWESSEFIMIIGSYYHMLMLNHYCCQMISWKSTLYAFMYTYIYICTYFYQYYICLVSLAVIVLVILMSTSIMTAGKGWHTLMVTIAMGPNRCRAITSFHSRSKGQIHPFQESTSRQKGLHPRKLTWIPKMMVWKRWFVLNMVIFGIYVKFLGGTNQTNPLHFETYPNLCNVATTSCDRPRESRLWFGFHVISFWPTWHVHQSAPQQEKESQILTHSSSPSKTKTVLASKKQRQEDIIRQVAFPLGGDHIPPLEAQKISIKSSPSQLTTGYPVDLKEICP